MTPVPPPTPDCPKCGESRSIDVIITGTQRSFYCAVCSHAWAADPPGDRRYPKAQRWTPNWTDQFDQDE